MTINTGKLNHDLVSGDRVRMLAPPYGGMDGDLVGYEPGDEVGMVRLVIAGQPRTVTVAVGYLVPVARLTVPTRGRRRKGGR